MEFKCGALKIVIEKRFNFPASNYPINTNANEKAKCYHILEMKICKKFAKHSNEFVDLPGQKNRSVVHF